MQFLLLILGALGGIGFWLWRMHMAASAARELADVAGELANLPRKMGFKRKAGKRGVDLITDPREAAAALIVGAAASKGDLTKESRDAIGADLATLFEISADEADEILSLATWHIGALNDPLNAVSKLSDNLLSQVGAEACADVHRLMLAAVERTEGPGDHAAKYYVSKFASRVGLGN